MALSELLQNDFTTRPRHHLVIPAQAGIQIVLQRIALLLGSRFRGSDERCYANAKLQLMRLNAAKGNRMKITHLSLLFIIALCSAAIHAQQYPSKPIR